VSSSALASSNACLAIGAIQNIIIEDREVEGKSKTARVCWRQFSESNIGGGLVSVEGLVGRVFPLAACGKLSQVEMVTTYPTMKSKSTREGYKTRELTSCCENTFDSPEAAEGIRCLSRTSSMSSQYLRAPTRSSRGNP
jgi:hypothetical protein